MKRKAGRWEVVAGRKWEILKGWSEEFLEMIFWLRPEDKEPAMPKSRG